MACLPIYSSFVRKAKPKYTMLTIRRLLTHITLALKCSIEMTRNPHSLVSDKVVQMHGRVLRIARSTANTPGKARDPRLVLTSKCSNEELATFPRPFIINRRWERGLMLRQNRSLTIK